MIARIKISLCRRIPQSTFSAQSKNISNGTTTLTKYDTKLVICRYQNTCLIVQYLRLWIL